MKGRERGTLTGTQYHSAMAKWKGGREREGERGGPSQGHNTIRPWQSGREGGRERGTLTETQYHLAILTN